VAELQNQRESEAQFQFGKLAALFEQLQLEEGEAESEAVRNEFQAALDALAEDFPRSRARGLSRLLEAKIAMASEDWALAEEKLRLMLPRLRSQRRDMAHFPLAVVLENQKKFEEAREEYENILQMNNSPYRSWALLGLARAQVELGNRPGAIESYQKYLEEFPNSNELPRVRGLIAMLEGTP
jgi:tetratricopeptide (TPR) repeat protein